MQLTATAHRAGLRITEEFVPVLRVAVTEPFGNQDLYPLPEQFLAWIAEQLLDLGVDQDDHSAFVHHEHPGGRGLDGHPELFDRTLSFR